MNANKPLWLEGMLIKPQHFQLSENYFEMLFKESLKQTPYNTGFKYLQLDYRYLKQGQLSIHDASGIMPDGTLFTLTINSQLENNLNIVTKKSQTLYLCLPTENNKRYQHEIEKVSNWLNPELPAHETDIGKLNFSIFDEQHALQYPNRLALAKVEYISGKFKVNADFCPAILDIFSNENSKKFYTQFCQLLNDTIKNLADTSHKKTERIIVEKLVASNLQTALANCRLIKHHEYTHPFTLFKIIYRLNYALAGILKLETHDLFDYHHDEIMLAYINHFEALQKAISSPPDSRVQFIRFNQTNDLQWESENIETKHLQKKQCILSIKSDIHTKNDLQRFLKNSKFTSTDKINECIQYGLSSKHLEILENPPNEIPYHAKTMYAHVDVMKLPPSNRLSFYIPEKTDDIEVNLWII